MDWFKEQIPALFKAYGWKAALVVIVVLVVLAAAVVAILGVDVTEFLP